jgi:hypothetical protein
MLLVAAGVAVAVVVSREPVSEVAADASIVSPTPPPRPPPPPASVPGYPGNWRRYQPVGGGFTVVGPGYPQETFANGVHRALFEDSGVTMTVDWFDEFAAPASEVSHLVFDTKRALKRNPGTVSEQHAISIEGHPGVALRIQGGLGGEGFFYVMRLFVVNGRSFQLAASIDPNRLQLRLIRARLFLNSFALT